MFPSRLVSVLGGGAGLPNNYSLDFDGSDDYVNCFDDSTFDLSDNLTLCGWIKTSAANAGYVLAKGNESDSDGYLVLVASSKLRFYNNNTATLISSTSVDDGAWHQFAITYNKSTTTRVIYIDGAVDITSTAFSASIGTSTEDFVIGALSDGTTGNFTGNIDEVAIWNTALSASSVSNIYNNGVPTDLNADSNSANLQGWWRMGDGTLDHRQTNGLVADQVTPTLGAEMLPNVGFEAQGNWVSNSPWTYDADNDNMSFEDGSSGRLGISDTNMVSSIVTGGVYKLTFTIGGGTAKFKVYDYPTGELWADTADYTVGDNTIYISPTLIPEETLGDAGLAIYGLHAGGAFTIDDISLKKVNGNAGILVNFDGSDFETETP